MLKRKENGVLKMLLEKRVKAKLEIYGLVEELQSKLSIIYSLPLKSDEFSDNFKKW